MKVYGSKMDSWIILVLLAAVAVSGSALVHTVLSGETGHRLSIPLLGLGVILPLWVIFSTNYRVDSQTLSIRSGPFRWRVPIAAIEDVRRARSWVSSPALSLDRLQIRHGGGKVVFISPRDRESFIRELDERRASVRRDRLH